MGQLPIHTPAQPSILLPMYQNIQEGERTTLFCFICKMDVIMETIKKKPRQIYIIQANHETTPKRYYPHSAFSSWVSRAPTGRPLLQMLPCIILLQWWPHRDTIHMFIKVCRTPKIPKQFNHWWWEVYTSCWKITTMEIMSDIVRECTSPSIKRSPRICLAIFYAYWTLT